MASLSNVDSAFVVPGGGAPAPGAAAAPGGRVTAEEVLAHPSAAPEPFSSVPLDGVESAKQGGGGGGGGGDSPKSPMKGSSIGASRGGTGDDEEEMSLLKSPLVSKGPFILVNEFCERLAYYGVAINIVVYATEVLKLSNSTAAKLINAWSGTCYITPLIGAFIADAYLGRYLVIIIFSLIYMLGLVGLSLSAGVSSLHPPADSTEGASEGQAAFFWIFMYLIALGTGGIKPCVSTFGADQFNENRPAELKLIPRFYNWFYFSVNVGAFLASTVLVWIQTDISWTVGFVIPAGAFVVALSVFILGSFVPPPYRKKPPAGSPFTRWIRTTIAAIANCRAPRPDNPEKLYEVEGPMSRVPGQPKLALTPEFKCLDKAAVVKKPAGAAQRWLVTVTEVEEVKCLWRLLPIMLCLIFYNCCYAQMSTLFVLQGSAMDTALGSWHVPAAMVNVLDIISVLIWVPLYDLVVYPFSCRIGRPISRLTRIGIGFGVAILSMVAGAVVEMVRLGVVHRHGLTNTDPTDPAYRVPMSCWWQIPQYFLVGMSEVFAMVGSLELFYSQSPEAMRSTASALQLFATGCGNYVSTLTVVIVTAITNKNGNGGWIADNLNQGHLDYFFWVIAVMMAITLICYIPIAMRFRYKQEPSALPQDQESAAAQVAGKGRLSARPSALSRASQRSAMSTHGSLDRAQLVVHPFEINPASLNLERISQRG